MNTDKIEGKNAVNEALSSGRTINKIWLLKPEGGRRLEPALAKILDAANERGIVVTRSPRNVLDRLSETHNHQGVIASVASHDYADLDEIIENARNVGHAPLLVALDELKDAYNLGSILRISDCCSVDGVIIPERRSIALDSQTLRNLKEKEGFWVCGTDMDGEVSYDEADYTGSMVIVIGSEGEGIREGVRKCCDFMVTIPMTGHVNSLNAAVAAGVVVFEAVKRRRQAKDN